MWNNGERSTIGFVRTALWDTDRRHRRQSNRLPWIEQANSQSCTNPGGTSDLYNEFRRADESEKEYINDDLVFKMELIKQIEINIDYILELVKKYHEDHVKNRELLVDINKAIDSSVELRNKKDLINQFIASLDIHSVVDEDWQKYVEKKRIEELEEIIKFEDLDRDETYKFVRNAFRNGMVATTGTDLAKVLPPVSRFSPGGERSMIRESVLDKLMRFFERFFDISSGKF